MKRTGKSQTGSRLRRRVRRGFTTAELLIVVAIIIALAGVTFIAVWNYQRSTGQLERDSVAKEIFVAAQNHLTAARNEFTGDFGIEDPGNKGIYYFVVDEGTTVAPAIVDAEEGSDGSSDVVTGSGQDAFSIMLPFGSIEETVRVKGSYLIRYQKETALVLDVFYCTTTGTKFDHTLVPAEYPEVLAVRGDDNKSARRNWKDGSILGWYGDVLAADLADITLEAPEITVTNADQLKVEINDPNVGKVDDEGHPIPYSVRLLITGETSKKEHYLKITSSEPIILDDITEGGPHFCNRTFDDEGENDFIPGENLHIRAVAFSTSVLSNIAYSGEKITNSLYADAKDSTGDDIPDTAYIGNFRHLENLSLAISNLDNNDGNDALDIVNAVQISDLKWGEAGSFWEGKRIQTASSTPATAKAGCFMPVDVKTFSLHYDGQSYSITGVVVDEWVGSAGLFGEIRDCSVENLELIDFSVSGTSNAGTLAGTVMASSGESKITNVLARNSRDYDQVENVKSSGGSAGGLIGSAMRTELMKCAASVYVSAAAENAGGLVGTSNGSIVTACYSGGHTIDGKYSGNTDPKDGAVQGLFNVIGGEAAGGLIGELSSTTVDLSYSTCSAYATNGAAGGLAGNAAGGTVRNSYSTGLVGADTTSADASVKAFIGSGTVNVSSCYYYSIVNEVKTAGKDTIDYLEPGVESGVTAFDADIEAYNDFIGTESGWKPANPYDSVLMRNYKGKYNLKTVSQLGISSGGADGVAATDFVSTHYGDWPSPETLIVNL